MENTLNNEIKTRVKGIAYYQIIGGIVGVVLAIFLFSKVVIITGFVVVFFACIITLYSFSVYCGWALLKGEIVKGLSFSKINQVLQVINFSVLGFAFKFVAGFSVSIGINVTNDFTFISSFSLSEFKLNINRDKEIGEVYINIVAIYLMYIIGKIQDKIGKIKINIRNVL